MIRLDIFSDPVCPWCYLGKANLDRALESAPDHPFQIEWHPFQLNPDMPPEGVDKRAYLADRFGGAHKVDAVHDRLREVARENGVALDPDVPKRIPNTLDAHRLIHWAGLEGRQTPLVAALFRAYWKEGRDIATARCWPISRQRQAWTAPSPCACWKARPMPMTSAPAIRTPAARA